MRSAAPPGGGAGFRPRRRRSVAPSPGPRASGPSRSRNPPPRGRRRYSGSVFELRCGSAPPRTRRSFGTARCSAARIARRPRRGPLRGMPHSSSSRLRRRGRAPSVGSCAVAPPPPSDRVPDGPSEPSRTRPWPRWLAIRALPCLRSRRPRPRRSLPRTRGPRTASIWSISFTTPSSNQTVRISRGTPSIVTRTELLLRTPQRGEKAREPRPAELSLHVPREGVVVRELLFDLHELIVQAASFLVDIPEGVEEAPFPVPPTFDLLTRRLQCAAHRHRPGALGASTVRVGIPPRRSVRTRLYSRIFFRTPSSSFRKVAFRRSSCRTRSRIRFRRSRHFFCSSRARRTLEESIRAPIQVVQTI